MLKASEIFRPPSTKRQGRGANRATDERAATSAARSRPPAEGKTSWNATIDGALR